MVLPIPNTIFKDIYGFNLQKLFNLIYQMKLNLKENTNTEIENYIENEIFEEDVFDKFLMLLQKD